MTAEAGSGAPATGNLSDRIAAFVTGVEAGTIPHAAFHYARRAFIDTIGVMLAGSQLKASEIVRGMIRSEGAREVVSIVGHAMRTTPQLAAFANGIASHGMDYDFSYLMGQPAASLIPALLPIAEEAGSSAEELLTAFVIGFEITSRFCRANPQHTLIARFHVTGSVGPMATAAAIARLRRLPVDVIPNAIGIAMATAGSTPVNFGTMTKPFHAGHAARSAVTAATLAANGFTASPVALEGRPGYFEVFGRDLPIHLEVFQELGSEYDLAKHGFTVKRYPSGGLGHPAIDAAIELHEELGPRVFEIESLRVGVTPIAGRAIKNTYPHSPEAAKFSAPYVIGYSLVHGAPFIDAFTEEALADPKVQEVAKTVSAFVEPEFGNPAEIPFPARLSLTFKNGERMERMKDYAIGSPGIPMSAEQLEEKFLHCTTRVIGAERAAALHTMLAGLGGSGSLDGLWELLRG